MTVPTLYGHPGIYINEQLLGPTPAPLNVSPSVAAFVGEHWRGPKQAVLCNGWQDFVKYFGGFNTSIVPVLANPYLAYSVYMYFANGGETCWVQRVTASATPGVSASTTLVDSAATPQGTLSLTAGVLGVPGNVGTWGNQLFADVVSSNSGAGRFNINVYNGGYGASFRVEQWIDLSMTATDARYAPAIINNPTQGSLWVVATDLGDATAPPNNAPAIVSGKQFIGGVDCASPSVADRIAVVTRGNATALLDYVPGVLNINMPGEVTTTVLSALLTYTQVRPYTFSCIETPSGQTPAGAVSFFNSLGPITADAAMYYPWQVATNPAVPNLGATILLPPGGIVLGQMVKSDNTRGVWKAPAGLSTVLSNVVRSERRFSSADLDTLTANNINALRSRPNGTVVVWGTRTMQNGYATKYVPVRRTLNYVEAALAQLLDFAVFEPNDPLLWTNITAACNGFLGNLWSAGAFGNYPVAQSYYVTCNSINNTPQSISQGIVNTTVGIALLIPAEFIALNIAQFQSSGTTTVTQTS